MAMFKYFSVEMEDEEGENEVVTDSAKPDLPVKPDTRSTRATTASTRQPLAAQQAQSSTGRPAQSTAGSDRMKKLEEFRKKKLALKLEAAKTKKPPFKGGVYKPDMAIVRPGI